MKDNEQAHCYILNIIGNKENGRFCFFFVDGFRTREQAPLLRKLFRSKKLGNKGGLPHTC
jgi:hypothetical protein